MDDHDETRCPACASGERHAHRQKKEVNRSNIQKGTTMIYRQGDVLLKKTRRILTAAKPVARDHGRIVLAYGEVTGHAHAIDAAMAELFEEKDGQLYLRVDAGVGVDLVHEEHATITLPPGTYQVVRQVEYSPAEIRRVAD